MSILIKNILLLNGTNQPATRADVLIKHDKIAAVGSFPQYKADEIFDGLGSAYLAPGFIDINTYSDLYLGLFSKPSQENFIKQGVTTIIGGQSGISLAPLLYGKPDLHRFWAEHFKFNTDWHSVGEFLDFMKTKKLGVNFGTFIGHSTVKEEIIGDDFRDLTVKEIDVFRLILDRSMKEGAFGISFDLNFPLTALTSTKEIKLFFEAAAKHRGLISFKLRNGSDAVLPAKTLKENFLPAVNEIINLAKETMAKTQINNFSCPKGLERDYESALDSINENSASADVFFNFHLSDETIIPAFYFLPGWALRGGFNEILKNINDSEIRKKIKKDMPILKTEEIVIFRVPEFRHLEGKTLKEFIQNTELDSKEGLLELLRQTKLKVVVNFRNLSLKRIPLALVNDRSIISSSGQDFDNRNPSDSGIGTFLNYLNLVFKDKILPAEKAIKKITSLPASRLGLKNRGVIKEGYCADLVLIRDGKIETVIVNGQITLRNGELTAVNAGKILKHSHV